jgi:hypothetical protein
MRVRTRAWRAPLSLSIPRRPFAVFGSDGKREQKKKMEKKKLGALIFD